MQEQLGDYYGMTIRQVHPLMKPMLVFFLIHRSTNLMLHDFSFIYPQT